MQNNFQPSHRIEKWKYHANWWGKSHSSGLWLGKWCKTMWVSDVMYENDKEARRTTQSWSGSLAENTNVWGILFYCQSFYSSIKDLARKLILLVLKMDKLTERIEALEDRDYRFKPLILVLDCPFQRGNMQPLHVRIAKTRKWTYTLRKLLLMVYTGSHCGKGTRSVPIPSEDLGTQSINAALSSRCRIHTTIISYRGKKNLILLWIAVAVGREED